MLLQQPWCRCFWRAEYVIRLDKEYQNRSGGMLLIDVCAHICIALKICGVSEIHLYWVVFAPSSLITFKTWFIINWVSFSIWFGLDFAWSVYYARSNITWVYVMHAVARNYIVAWCGQRWNFWGHWRLNQTVNLPVARCGWDAMFMPLKIEWSKMLCYFC